MNIVDLSTDSLASAPLTPEQREVWTNARAELIDARAKIQDMEIQLRSFRQAVSDTDNDRSILTRPEFNREVARMLAFDERYGGLSSVLYFDFENFGDIAKNFGNAAANSAARTICDILAKSIRTSDILGRLALNEFGIMLVRCDNAQAWKKGETLAIQLQQALSEIDGHKITPRINYGAYTFHENEDVAGGIKHAAESVTHK
ncbi:MAG: diguanylate cyclase [Alphaproteobacteria bacterium]|nr:diguanylate cyclase [Alphaproteobacteria bacterium]